MQPLFDLAHDPYGDDHRDHMPLVAHQRHLVQTAEHRLHHLHAGGDGPGVLQVGVDHDHADDRPQERVAPKHLGGRKSDQNRQKHIGCVGKQLCKYKQRAGGVQLYKAVGCHEVQRFHQAHQKAGSHNGGDDGDKDVSQRLDAPPVPGGTCGSRLLDCLFAGVLHAGQLDKRIINFVYDAGAKDDLQLALGFKYALDPFYIFQRLFVRLGVVCDHKTQPGGAVGCGEDVCRAAYTIQHLLCDFRVVHIPLLLYNRSRGSSSFALLF